jgi:4-hydroxy-tetrahydrodipicolinate synthase
VVVASGPAGHPKAREDGPGHGLSAQYQPPSTYTAGMNIDGVHVPVVTPFRADGSIDLDCFAQVIEHNIAGGVRGIVPAGTTGEYYAMTTDERLEVFRATREIVAGRALLIAGCNAGATRDAAAFACAAADLGYDAIMLAVPPTSLPSQSELAAHFTSVAEAAGLPAILYNFPARAGVEVGWECLELVADNPLIVAMKESSGDFSRFLALQRAFGSRIEIVCGSDDQALDYFFHGVTSWIAGTANVLPRHHTTLLELVRAEAWEKAHHLRNEMLPWVMNMESGGYNQKAKLGIEAQGIPTGPVRQPLLPLTDDVVAAWKPVFDRALAARLPSATAAD